MRQPSDIQIVSLCVQLQHRPSSLATRLLSLSASNPEESVDSQSIIYKQRLNLGGCIARYWHDGSARMIIEDTLSQHQPQQQQQHPQLEDKHYRPLCLLTSLACQWQAFPSYEVPETALASSTVH
ncbi:hypothetical protein TYRP_000109 [Tyrophagus putrescentiae]|nr:hypothetical protein TYRP_000109 [Tyrophagus putrescentiae]